MRSPLYKYFLFVFTFMSFNVAYSQLNVKVGERFLSNEVFTKIHVCVEDHSVWAISSAGKVYFKRSTDPDFAIYPATAQLNVTGVSGYNSSEMYFILGNKVLQIINGNQQIIDVSYPGVTKVNDIAVNYGKETAYLIDPNLSYHDYLAIATDNDLYYVLRGNSNITSKYVPRNAYFYSKVNFQIGYSGYKHQNYRYTAPSDYCGVQGYHENDDRIGEVFYWSVIPETPPYSSNVTASILATHYYQPFTSTWKEFHNIWSTDDGVYVRQTHSCASAVTKKHLAGEHVNTLEDINALTAIRKQDFIFAGSNTGIFYTKKSFFPEMFDGVTLDLLKFERLADFPNIKVNMLKVETDVLKNIKLDQDVLFVVCERVIWVASDQGIHKLYLSLDQDHYKNLQWNNMRYSMTPSNGDFENPVFKLCGNETVTLSTQIPEILSNQVLLQWFKDGVEVPELLGKFKATLTDGGVYTVKLTSLCEGITLNSKQFKVDKETAPNITFNYPATITLCEGEAQVFTTAQNPAYLYRWYKDGDLILNETRNTYTALTDGIYHVEVSNCSGSYIASETSRLTIQKLTRPVIVPDKITYCGNATANLTVENPLGMEIKWYYAAAEVPEYKNQVSINTTKPGKYMVAFTNSNGCVIQSNAIDFTTSPVPPAIVSRNTNRSLCFGESVTLSVANTAGASYLWSNGSTGREITVKQSGDYSVVVTTPGGCFSVSAPTAVLVGGPITLAKPAAAKLCKIKGEKITLLAAEGYASYTWNGKRGLSNSLEVDATGDYNLEVEDENGCKAATVYQVLPSCNTVEAPNAFSPNGDGVNDVWEVSGLEADPNAKITVYNTHGSIIFTTSGKQPRWDGKLAGAGVPVGTYFFVVKSSMSSSMLSGSVTVIR